MFICKIHRMRNTIFGLVIAVFVLLSSCKKNNGNHGLLLDDVAEPGTVSVNAGGQTLSMGKDTSDRLFVYVSMANGKYITSLNLYKATWSSRQDVVEQEIMLQVRTDGPAVTGTPYEGTAPLMNATYRRSALHSDPGYPQPAGTNCIYSAYASDKETPIKVVFDKLDTVARLASGTFSFRGKSSFRGCANAINIAEGRFTDIGIRTP